jgi:hypothetical protein
MILDWLETPAMGMLSLAEHLVLCSRIFAVASPTEVIDHPTPTRRRGLLYQFTPKHHGGARGQATWLPDVSDADEFSIFDDADAFEIIDDNGNLYGVFCHTAEKLREIGHYKEQVAEFPVHGLTERWHGYPVWALDETGPRNRRSQKCKPAKLIFDKLRDRGLINKRQ